MRKFQPVIGREVDLDDPATYTQLPQTIRGVLDNLYGEIGYAMLYILGDHWSVHSPDQCARVNAMVKDIAKHWNERPRTQPLIFWQEKLYLFMDETENMC